MPHKSQPAAETAAQLSIHAKRVRFVQIAALAVQQSAEHVQSVASHQATPIELFGDVQVLHVAQAVAFTLLALQSFGAPFGAQLFDALQFGLLVLQKLLQYNIDPEQRQNNVAS